VRQPVTTVFLSVLVALLGASAAAWGAAFEAVETEDDYGLVLLDDVALFEIREASGGYDPLERAEIVAGRLEDYLDDGDLEGEGEQELNVKVGTMNNETVVYLWRTVRREAQRELIITVDWDTADAYGYDTWVLAHWWRDLLRDMLNMRAGEDPLWVEDLDYLEEAAKGVREGGQSKDMIREVSTLEERRGTYVSIPPGYQERGPRQPDLPRP